LKSKLKIFLEYEAWAQVGAFDEKKTEIKKWHYCVLIRTNTSPLDKYRSGTNIQSCSAP
jgi:hypothetical protein